MSEKVSKGFLETKCGCVIRRDSREHDECRCDDNGDNWICADCYKGEYDKEEQLICPHCDRNEKECEEKTEKETNPITEWCGWGLSCDDCYYKNNPEDEEEEESSSEKL